MSIITAPDLRVATTPTPTCMMRVCGVVCGDAGAIILGAWLTCCGNRMDVVMCTSCFNGYSYRPVQCAKCHKRAEVRTTEPVRLRGTS